MNQYPLLACVVIGALSAIPATAVRQANAPRQLIEEVRIVSDESSPQKSLTPLTGLTVLSDGSIVTFHGARILTMSPGVVAVMRGGGSTEMIARIYDGRGSFVRTVGRRGDGPGEFRQLGRNGSIGDDIWVNDMTQQRTTVIDRTGALRRTIADRQPPDRQIWSVVALLAGQRELVVCSCPARTQSGASDGDSIRFVVADSAGVVQQRLATLPPPLHGDVKVQMEQRAPMSIPQPLVGSIAVADAPGGNRAVVLVDAELFGGRPGEVRITDWNAGQISTRVVSTVPRRVAATFRDSLAKMYSDAYRGPAGTSPAAVSVVRTRISTAIRSDLFIPEYYPVIAPLSTPAMRTPPVLGRDGTIWINNVGQTEIWSVVAGDRVVMQVRVPLELTIHAVSRTQVWATRVDADSLPVILRYRVE